MTETRRGWLSRRRESPSSPWFASSGLGPREEPVSFPPSPFPLRVFALSRFPRLRVKPGPPLWSAAA